MLVSAKLTSAPGRCILVLPKPLLIISLISVRIGVSKRPKVMMASYSSPLISSGVNISCVLNIAFALSLSSVVVITAKLVLFAAVIIQGVGVNDSRCASMTSTWPSVALPNFTIMVGVSNLSLTPPTNLFFISKTTLAALTIFSKQR